jgi:PAS domain-containing protein
VVNKRRPGADPDRTCPEEEEFSIWGWMSATENGVIVDADPIACRLLRRPRETFLATNLWDVFDPADHGFQRALEAARRDRLQGQTAPRAWGGHRLPRGRRHEPSPGSGWRYAPRRPTPCEQRQASRERYALWRGGPVLCAAQQRLGLHRRAGDRRYLLLREPVGRASARLQARRDGRHSGGKLRPSRSYHNLPDIYALGSEAVGG